MYFFILFGLCVLLFLSYHGVLSLLRDFKKAYPIHAWFLSNPRLLFSLFLSTTTTTVSHVPKQKRQKRQDDQIQISSNSFEIQWDSESYSEIKSFKAVPYVLKDKEYIFLVGSDKSNDEIKECLQKYLQEKHGKGIIYSIDHPSIDQSKEKEIKRIFGPYGVAPLDDHLFDFLDYHDISGRITIKRIGGEDVYETVMKERIK